MPSEDEQFLINVNLPLKILHIRVIDWALTHNFASFLDIDRAAAKHLERMDQVVYSAARLNLSVTRVRSNFNIYSDTEAAPDLGADGEGDNDSDEGGETGSSGTSETTEEDSGDDQGEGNQDTGSGDTGSAAASMETAAVDQAQDLTVAAIQSQGGKVGYFSALLTRYNSGFNLANAAVGIFVGNINGTKTVPSFPTLLQTVSPPP